MIYLDSSALLKSVIKETESEAFSLWFYEQDPDSLVSSRLTKVEVLRATRRAAPDNLAAATRLLDGIRLVPVIDGVVDSAARLDSAALRTLDAIHLASALSLDDDLTAFVSYDTRLLVAADSIGLPTVSPS